MFPTHLSARQIIDTLQLEPLPQEGGYFRRIFTHPLPCPHEVLPNTFQASRELASAIYFLVTSDSFSALHRIPSVESFHFHYGDPLEMLQLHPDGTGSILRIGSDPTRGESPAVIVPGGTWQGTRLALPPKSCPHHGFALLSVVVMPAFDWKDFELGDREVLINLYPTWQDDIIRYTH